MEMAAVIYIQNIKTLGFIKGKPFTENSLANIINITVLTWRCKSK